MVNKSSIRVTIIFTVLFLFYHAAEYMIVFRNSPLGFFGMQLLFFLTAFLAGNGYSKNGLAAWGLPFTRKAGRLVLWGAVSGILLYGVTYAVTLLSGIEKIVGVPGFWEAVNASYAFAFGVLLSSFSEDVLTRGLLYAHFGNRMRPFGLILLSASVYLLNHIYRLGDGIETLGYLFLLGVLFIIPVLHTRNLWLTGGMHWAGNTFFYVSHNVVKTADQQAAISSNAVFILCILVFIPIIWYFSKRFVGNAAVPDSPKPADTEH